MGNHGWEGEVDDKLFVVVENCVLHLVGRNAAGCVEEDRVPELVVLVLPQISHSQHDKWVPVGMEASDGIRATARTVKVGDTTFRPAVAVVLSFPAARCCKEEVSAREEKIT